MCVNVAALSGHCYCLCTAASSSSVDRPASFSVQAELLLRDLTALKWSLVIFASDNINIANWNLLSEWQKKEIFVADADHFEITVYKMKMVL